MPATLDDLRRVLGSTTGQADLTLESKLAVAVSWVEDRVMVASVDAPEVVEAELLLASRLYKRRQSPEGVAGFGDLGIIRILARDPDIELLLEAHVDYTKAGIA
jgi:hypothetical protein